MRLQKETQPQEGRLKKANRKMQFCCDNGKDIKWNDTVGEAQEKIERESSFNPQTPAAFSNICGTFSLPAAL